MAVIRNTFRLVSVYRISNGFLPFWAESWPVQGLKKYFPDDVDNYEKTWQAKSRLKRVLNISEKPLTMIFWLSAIACLVYIGLKWKARREDEIFKASVFGVIAVLVNAFFTSNISGVYGRFHARIGFILIFPGLIILTKLADSLLKGKMVNHKDGKISGR